MSRKRRRPPTHRPQLEALETRAVFDASGGFVATNPADNFDVNNDGAVNVADLGALNKALKAQRDGTELPQGEFDVNSDGKLTPDDALKLLRELGRLHPNGQKPTPPPTTPTEPRSFDGTGNNLANPEWGSTGEQFTRRAPADYADGVSAPAGEDRPSPREISNVVMDQDESILNDRRLSAMIWQWGQFIDHDLDLSLTQTGDSAETLPIAVPTGDPDFDPNSTGTATIPFTRTIYDPATGDAVGNEREQINSITAYMDGSQVYGSDQATADSLREFSGGRLKTSGDNLLPTDANGFFQAGDIRVNEQVGLISMQTLWVREHNRIADKIASDHPELTDEQIYQKARSLVIGELQAITYNEFLPALLGRDAIRPYSGYKADVNVDVSNLFATAAYRFGHSTLSSEILRLNDDGTTAAEGNLTLAGSFFNTSAITDYGIDSLLKGLASQQMQEVDVHVIDDVRNFLFGPPGAGGLDLASLNIQRGRDHGLPSYNDAREQYGLPRVTSFSQITSDAEVAANLEEVYGSVENIDVWVGGLAEDHVRGASVGPLVRAVLVDQFTRTRDGDRYWYQNSLTGRDLEMVSRTSLSDVIERNTDLTSVQQNAFVVPRTEGTPQAPPPEGRPQLPPPPPPTGQQPTSPPTGQRTSGSTTTTQPTTPPMTPTAPPTQPTTPSTSTTTKPTQPTNAPPPQAPLPPPPPPTGTKPGAAMGTTSTGTTSAKPAPTGSFTTNADQLFSALGKAK